MLGTNLVQLDLKKIVSTTQTPGEYHESDLRLVSMFLWEQGKFKQFLQLIQKRDKNGYDSYFEAAMGIPIDRAIPLWQDYLNKIVARRSEIMRLPLSAILPDEPTFRKFIEPYGIPVVSQ
jgi:hypothetical protein